MTVERRSPVLRYGVSILAFMAALALRVLGHPILEHDSPFLFFFSALALASWYGGFGPGLLATVLGAIAAAVLFLPPIIPGGTIEINHLLEISAYIVTGAFISVLMEKFHVAIELSATAERELETRVKERTALLDQANQELEAEKDKLLGILDQMREAVYIVNSRYEIEYTNPAMEREFGPVNGQKCYQYLNDPQATVCSWCKNSEVFDGKSFIQEWASPKNNRVYDCFDTPIVIRGGLKCKLKIMHDITGLKQAEAELISKHQQIQKLSSELLTAQETQRMRISKELHDELGQSLTLIKLKIGLITMGLPGAEQQLKELCDDASAHVDQAIENMRRLSRDLSPVTLETLGVTIALRRLAEEFDRAGRIRITADIDPVDDLLPMQFNILLYRIFQEALNNIVKHSGARSAAVFLKKCEHSIRVEMRDDGKGLDMETDNSANKGRSGGMGLAIMRERVRTLGGDLMIESRESSGTRLHFEIPTGNRDIENNKL